MTDTYKNLTEQDKELANELSKVLGKFYDEKFENGTTSEFQRSVLAWVENAEKEFGLMGGCWKTI